jgi:two-component system, CitB family, sensor kinase
MSLRMQLLLLQVAIVLITVIGTGIVASWMQEQQLRDAYRDRMIGVAQSVARLPAIIDAFDQPNPSDTIQPIAEVVRKASNVTYVVVTNEKGIRYSHPDPSRIGQEVSTDPGTALSGKMYVGTQTGTLGESWRVKLPIFDADHKVMGVVSVGILESDLRNDYLGNSTLLFITIGGAAILGVIGAAGVSAVIRRRIYGLEPDEIAGLLETREAMLHGVREGLVALDESGRISLINDAGVQLLGLDPAGEFVGLPASEVLDAELIGMAAEETTEQRLVLSGERVLLVRRDSATIGERAIGAMLILRDNTELHALLRDLDGAQDLADGLRSQAHGFANQLHVISGLLELGHISEAVAFIERAGSGGSLSSVTDSSGIRDLEVAALLLVKQTRAKELGIVVEIGHDSSLAPIPTDPVSTALRTDLITVVGNLLDNAVEACQYGGHIDVSIVLPESDEAAAGELTVTVGDNGPGIPRRLRERVFSPGYSSKTAPPGRLSPGRGIGLTLVRRIAQRYGGRVVIADRSPCGACVTVHLPLGQLAVVEAAATPHGSAV